ncbi:MAG: hypothetical protein QMD71_06200 [bacterium]|nr:hypothetical protein [bacterium]
MCTLTTFNKAEKEMLQARSLEKLNRTATWLKTHFENNPEDKELIWNDLAKLYIRRKQQLQPKPTTRQARIYIKQWLARKIGTPSERSLRNWTRVWQALPHTTEPRRY